MKAQESQGEPSRTGEGREGPDEATKTNELRWKHKPNNIKHDGNTSKRLGNLRNGTKLNQ